MRNSSEMQASTASTWWQHARGSYSCPRCIPLWCALWPEGQPEHLAWSGRSESEKQDGNSQNPQQVASGDCTTYHFIAASSLNSKSNLSATPFEVPALQTLAILKKCHRAWDLVGTPGTPSLQLRNKASGQKTWHEIQGRAGFLLCRGAVPC